MFLFLALGPDARVARPELLSARRCMALLLYHGSAVGVHTLAACLLWRQTAAYRHERIKCLTLVVAFVIMMVRRRVDCACSRCVSLAASVQSILACDLSTAFQ